MAYNHDQNNRGSRHSIHSKKEIAKLEIDGEDFNAFYSTARIVLIINDLNDESPIFLLNQTDYSFDLYTDEVRRGTKVGQLFAFDLDGEDKGSLVFEQEFPNGGGSFFDVTEIKATDRGDLMGLQAVAITTNKELTPTKYEIFLKAVDKANHITKCRVFVSYKLRDPPIPVVEWLQDGENIVKNNLLVVRLTKNQILPKENKKVLSLKAKLGDSRIFNQNQLRYKQLDNGQFFKVNELNGDIFYTDNLINDNDKTKDINVLVQPIYVNEQIQPKQLYYLPQIVCVNFVLGNENKNVPKFIVPSNNHTVIDFNLNDENGNFAKSNGDVFRFIALNVDGSISNDNFEYKLMESAILKNFTIQDFFEDDDQIVENHGIIIFNQKFKF